MKASHKREIMLLMLLLVLFEALIVISIINLRREIAVFGLGIGYMLENYIIIILSFLSIIRVFYAIISH